jgi:hypothetical protein
MAPRFPLAILPALLALAVVACGSESAQTPDVATSAAASGPADIAGMFRVKGTTKVVGTDAEREIAGTVTLQQEGSAYTATFSLETLYPGPDGPLPAEVVGTGEGTVEGNNLVGTARTQIVASRIPGIDPSFSLIPPTFGVKIVSSAIGELRENGEIQFEIENRAAEGERYIPTRTVVSGGRVDATTDGGSKR